MTPAGAVLAGTTVLVAAMDGGLSAMVYGAATGGAAYVAARRMPNNMVEGVVKTQLANWDERIAKEPDPDRKKDLRTKMVSEEKLYRARMAWDRDHIKVAAIAVGIGVAMAPGVGLALAVLYTRKFWLPVVAAIVDEHRDSVRRSWESDHSNDGYALLYRTCCVNQVP